ncbi:hypothetical protein SAMN04488074_107321 [Lentzea albidocapillata subsp. violacea]|uniref:Uncharacterized protein n=1 Tax=Lentzea albidocapillata subsp. violacea TaxID=128104 RepID=A0A1G9FCZ4_9PSEU|nr:hypothetical protein SAMN04488074_107321 [Lentzea albidocapillata subsp. violacea]
MSPPRSIDRRLPIDRPHLLGSRIAALPPRVQRRTNRLGLGQRAGATATPAGRTATTPKSTSSTAVRLASLRPAAMAARLPRAAPASWASRRGVPPNGGRKGEQGVDGSIGTDGGAGSSNQSCDPAATATSCSPGTTRQATDSSGRPAHLQGRAAAPLPPEFSSYIVLMFLKPRLHHDARHAAHTRTRNWRCSPESSPARTADGMSIEQQRALDTRA